MTGRKTWNARDTFTAITTLLVLVGCARSRNAYAREQAPDGMSGRVVDAGGAGVAAAKVWVIGGSMAEPEVVAETSADGQGAFSFPTLWKDLRTSNALKRLSHSFSLAARDGRGRIGWITATNSGTKAPNIVTLVEPGEARGRVVDTAGKPIVGAEIVPAVFVRSRERHAANDYLRLTAALSRPLATTTAADGSFTLRGIPAGCEVHANVTRGGFGAPRVSWDSTKPVTITLDGRVGRINGRLVTPDGKDLGSRLSLGIMRNQPADEPTARPFVLIYSKRVSVQGDGRFRFDELPPGHYAINLESAPDLGFAADTIHDVEVGPGATIGDLRIPLRQLVAITGRVVDGTSGQGVEAVWVNASINSGAGMAYGDSDVTDARGRYTVHVAPGKLVIQPTSIPRSHLGLNYESLPQLDVTGDREWPDFKLNRAAAIDGIVVDSAGKPVAGAEVHALKQGAMGFADTGPPAKTGPDGLFRLEQLDPDDTLPVRARTKDATTDGAVVIEPGKHSGKLTLVIDPKYAARLHGVIRDRSGKAVAGAKVGLGWGRNYVSRKIRFSGVGSTLEGYETDGEGRFASAALWPGDRYKVTVEATGYGNAESPEITGRAGENHDFGAIRLVATGGRVVGQVLDAAGKPVADATVFNRGDAPEPLTARTDSGGNFQLEGFFDGGKYIFIRKDGYRFNGMRVERDSGAVTLTLRRMDETPPPWASERRATPDEEKALARRVLTKLWERYGENANNNGAFECILQMARIDVALALKWSTDTGGRFDDQVYQAAAEIAADADGESALELLRAPKDGSSAHVLQKLAERFAGEDRDKALKFAEESAVQARLMPQPDRTGAIARAGAMLSRLGRKEAGLALVNEAAEAAKRMGLEGREAYARGNVAGALAAIDVERALALVEPMKNENDRDRYLGFIATALASSDLKRALDVAGKIGDRSSTPQSVKVAIVYGLGVSGRADEAMKVIEGMKSHYAAPKYQSEAYAWLAVAVAPRDKSRTAMLVEKALNLPVDQPQEFRSWIYFGGGAGEAGWTAACAKRAGYDDMASAVLRVLAARPSGRNGDPSTEVQCQTGAAAILALTDPKAASQMLRDLELRWGQRLGELGRIAGRRWLMAWALADPSHAEQLFEAELAALESRPNANVQSTGVFKMVEVLVQPPKRREEFLRNEIGATWYPGIDE